MNVSATSKVLIQGIFEPLSLVYTPIMRTYGTQIVAGVSSGHGGENLQGIPIFDLVEQAVAEVGCIDISISFVSPYLLLDAALEAIAAGIRQLVLISSGIPPLDLVHLSRKAEATQTLIVGPNSPGLIVPGEVLLGTHPTYCYTPGNLGILSYTGTLTYEIALELTQSRLGQSIVVGLGNDSITGSSLQQWMQLLNENDRTTIILVIGEVGSSGESPILQMLLDSAQTPDHKPLIAYVAGRRVVQGAPPIGHAWAIATSRLSEPQANPINLTHTLTALKLAGISVAYYPSDIIRLVKRELRRL
jgi:succinyl-CoA synthetase alpha subunit